MKNILPVISLLVLFIALLPSCDSLFNNEDKINDYLPLKVGAKYRYNYSEGYSYIDGYYNIKGECTWEFISMSVDTPVIYQVKQSFTGYSRGKDSTRIENQISTLSFEVQNDGKVAFYFSVPYWGATKVTFDRFIQSHRIDTCFTLYRIPNRGCLRKNVGITSIDYFVPANHSAGVSYSLIEGPYY